MQERIDKGIVHVLSVAPCFLQSIEHSMSSSAFATICATLREHSWRESWPPLYVFSVRDLRQRSGKFLDDAENGRLAPF